MRRKSGSVKRGVNALLKWVYRRLKKLPAWQKLVIALCLPLFTLNSAVAFFGSSLVFPLSPYFLKEKWSALVSYAKHRPTCLFYGHGDLGLLADVAEKKHGLPRGLMRAVVEVESHTKAHRISAAGAMGAAQLMPGTVAMLQVSDPFNPVESIDAGARYLAQQFRRTGRVDLAVAAYNAGPGAVNGRIPQNGETEFYVRKVMKELNRQAP